MKVQNMDEALLLRLGLAARALPDTEPRRLLAVLSDALGTEITPVSLATLTPKQLTAACNGELAEIAPQDIQKALDYLQGAASIELEDDVPCVDTGDPLEGALRMAVASNQADMADGHFASCARFLICEVNATDWRLADVRGARPPQNVAEKNAWRAELIEDCDLVFLASIGGPPAAQINKRGIHPIKTQPDDRLVDLVKAVQEMVSDNPPPWIRKRMVESAAVGLSV